MLSYRDIRAYIETRGRIPSGMVRRVARLQAEQELQRSAKIGWRRDFDEVFAHRLTMVNEWAKAFLDDHLYQIERAKLTPYEREARTCELNAALAESAIPPSYERARLCRAQAAEMRARDPSNVILKGAG